MDISIDGDIPAQNNQTAENVSLPDFSARFQVSEAEPQSMAGPRTEAGPKSEAQLVDETMTT